MVPSGQIQQYLALLEIRRVAARRNTIITGILFGGSAALALFTEPIPQQDSRAIIFVLILILILGLSFLSALSRLELIQNIKELAEVVQREIDEPK